MADEKCPDCGHRLDEHNRWTGEPYRFFCTWPHCGCVHQFSETSAVAVANQPAQDLTK